VKLFTDGGLMKLNSFEDLFVCLLSDIYVVENRLLKDLPILVKRAESPELKETLQTHLGETKEHIKRLDKIFKLLKEQPHRLEWAGDIHNIFADAGAFLTENTPSAVLDAAIIAIAQRIEHFEIATYGTLLEFSKVLNYNEIENILGETIKEEAHADKLLTKLAKGSVFTTGINVKAAR
jgi:ferritin-like metal-binding protein YciE